MTITWHGYSCIKLTESTKDGDLVVLIDPFKEGAGEKLPRSLTANIAIATSDAPRHHNLGAVQGDPFTITTPGEFEVKDIFVTGYAFQEKGEGKSGRTHTLAYVTIGDMHVLHLGGIQTPPDDTLIENIGAVDILCVPVGGSEVLSPADAAKVARKFEPRVIVPMYYRADGVGAGLESVDTFLKASGLAKTEVLSKYKLAKKDLPQEDTVLVLLEPQ